MKTLILALAVLALACINSPPLETSYYDMDGTWSASEHVEYWTEGGGHIADIDQSGEVLFIDQIGPAGNINGSVSIVTQDGLYLGSERFYGDHPEALAYYTLVTDGFLNKEGGTITNRYYLVDSTTDIKIYWAEYIHQYSNLEKTRKF